MSRYDAIERHFWPNGPSRDVWMIVDCARDQKRIFRFLLSCHLEQTCLYSGSIAPALEMAAPYLLQLEYQNQETRQLIDLSWGNSWGIFLRSSTSMRNLRTHLRKFLIVQDTQRRRMTFRYYDPNILRVYLPTCTGEELRTVFGPIDFYWTEEGEDTDQLLEFQHETGRLISKTRSLSLDPPAVSP